MPSFELDKLQAVTGLRALAETDRSLPETAPRPNASGGSADSNGVSLEIGGGLDVGRPPVASERVVEVRDALRDGTYPLVPAKIADAIIAAQLRPIVGE